MVLYLGQIVLYSYPRAVAGYCQVIGAALFGTGAFSMFRMHRSEQYARQLLERKGSIGGGGNDRDNEDAEECFPKQLSGRASDGAARR